MPVMDADWKLIQKNTFTRWTNEHLRQVNKVVADLEVDFSDGVRLIALVESLSQKNVGRFNKRPVHRNQKLENISICLEFLQHVEKIKIVNIDSSDIVGCNMKLILGLIWTLILHYSISMPMWDGESNGFYSNNCDQTPKQKLLGWITSRVPDRPIRNFTTDWNDGTAIGALVDAVAPGLCPDWMTWDPKRNVANATEAMTAAEQWLDVPQLIKPTEMCDSMVDELSMMTYLSQFPSARLKQGAPLRPRTNPARVRAFGPGIESSGNTVGTCARFTVETFSAGRGDVKVRVINPQGASEQCQISFNNDKLISYTCAYVPTMPGQYQVEVKFAGHEITKSPFLVRVDDLPGDSSKVIVRGPGIEKSGVMVNRNASFEVLTKNAGSGGVDVIIMDPFGHKDTVHPFIHKRTDDVWTVDYTPFAEGIHKISVLFAGKQIPGSPFSVIVSPALDARKCYVTGRGIQPKGIRVEDVCEYEIHTENAGSNAELNTKVIGPNGNEERVNVKKRNEVTYECTYCPKRVGQYVVSAMYGGQPVARSPFRVGVAPMKDTRIRAFGPGLKHGIVGYPACFTVETNGETGALGFSVEGPSQAKIECKDNGDGSADISYWPTAPGEYAIHILCSEEDIPLSPFMANISPTTNRYDPTKVRVSGLGVQKSGVTVSKWAEFFVDARPAGHASLNVIAFETDHRPVEVIVKDNKDGTYSCRYLPERGVKHTVIVSYGYVSVPNSPFRVLVRDASYPARVKVFGPSIEGPVKVNQPTQLFVDCSDAGPGDVAISLTDERGFDVPVKTKNQENLFHINFEPSSLGTYTASVFFADQEIPNSPFRILVEPSIDVREVIIQGLSDRVYIGSLNDFTINACRIDPHGNGRVKATLIDPSGMQEEVPITNNKDGTYTGIFTPFDKGLHQLDITYNGVNIPHSPFTLTVVSGCDPNRVKAFGPGLKGGNTDHSQKFTVETQGAGSGDLSLSVEGPSEAKVSCVNNYNGRYTVEYLPTKAGTYDVAIKFGGKLIPGSPFHVEIVDEVNPSKVRCYGPGIESEGVRRGQPGNFTIDASNAGSGTPEVMVTDRQGKKTPGRVKARGDGTFDAVYYLDVEGPSKVEVSYAGRPVAGSPFSSRILPPYDATKVRVTGDGVKPDGVIASLPTTFLVDTRDAGLANHDIIILDPLGDFVRPTILDKGDRTFFVTYTPCDVGRFTIHIKYGDDQLPLSPFYVMTTATGDASQVKILDELQGVIPVGETHFISLDTSRAGIGNVTCSIHGPSDSDIDLDIVDNHGGDVRVAYVPSLPGVYAVSLRFGGNPIPNGQISQQAVDQKSFIEKEMKLEVGPLEAANREHLSPVEFIIPVGPIFSFVSAEITMPSGKKHSPKLNDNRNGMMKIIYEPLEVGLHRLDVKYNQLPLVESPFHFYVHSLRQGNVIAFGPGLSHGIIQKPCNFTIITKDAGPGGLSLAVEGPSKAEINCHDNKDGSYSVTYLPTVSGEYSIIIRFSDHHIEGSPFTAKVMAPVVEEQKMAEILFGANSEVSLKVDQSDISSLNANIRSPSGEEKRCPLKRLANGQMGIPFIPREIGDYWVSVFQSGKHIPNSPFRIAVTESQIGNASQVTAFGKGLSTGSANEISEFCVDTKNAGCGNLNVSIEGPSKADMNCEDRGDGTCRVMYQPTEPGNYIINVKFAEEHIPGSPYFVKIEGRLTGRITERIVKRKEDLSDVHIGSDCELSLCIPGSSRYDLEASVTSPSGLSETCSVQERQDDDYVVRFVPREMGLHLVSVQHKGISVPGSPFTFTVGPVIEGGADKVQALGLGLEAGEVAVPSTFTIYTREAGAGGLSIAIEGPSKAEIDFQDRKDGSCEVTYVCSESGDYLVTIKFNDDHISGSPFKVHVAPSAVDARKMTLHELQDRNYEINKPAAVAVDLSGVQGQLDARIIAPSGAEEQAIIHAVEKNRCAVRFIPRENGHHLIHVRSDGNHVPGSPFQVQVGREESVANQVKAIGEGLSHGMTDQSCKFIVNTTEAGPGSLTVTIDGPSKVQLNCYEISEGYEFLYTPTEPGTYHVNIRYGGNTHIPGSPFNVHIEGFGRYTGLSDVIVKSVTRTSTTQNYAASRKLNDSDASKITATGTGLQKATANKEATFLVNTAHAGYNALMVGMIGPNDPCEEIVIKHIGQRQYNVSYIVRDCGNFHLIVKWGDEHIPGSPFQIHVQ